MLKKIKKIFKKYTYIKKSVYVCVKAFNYHPTHHTFLILAFVPFRLVAISVGKIAKI